MGSIAVGGQANRHERCMEKHQVAEIPKAIKREIRHYYKSRFVMVNPEEKFQGTDVVNGKMLKERRLIFWSRCVDDFYLVYEHGGYAYHKHAILLRQQNGSYRIHKNIGPGKSATLDEIKKALMDDERTTLDHF